MPTLDLRHSEQQSLEHAHKDGSIVVGNTKCQWSCENILNLPIEMFEEGSAKILSCLIRQTVKCAKRFGEYLKKHS